MSISRTNASNSSFMLGGMLVSKGALLISMLILSHYMKDADFGLLALAIALGQVLYIASDMGTSMVVNRRLSLGRISPGAVLPTASAVRLAFSLIGLLLLWVVAVYIEPTSKAVGMIMLVGIGSCLDSYTELAFSVFRSAERMGGEGLTRSVSGLSSIALAVAVIFFDLGPIAVAATYAIRSVVALVVSGLMLRGFGASMLPALDIRGARSMVAEGWQLGLMMLAMVGWQRMDNLILNLRLGPESVAAWQESYRLLDTLVLLIAPTLLPGALFPGLCRAYDDSRASFEHNLTGLAQITTGLGLLSSILLLSGGGDLLRMLWGVDYLRGFDEGEMTSCFLLVSLSPPVVFWMNLLVAAMIASGRNREVLKISLLAIALSGAVNILLIGALGLIAPAVAVIASNLLLSLLFYRDLCRGRFLKIFGQLWRAIVPLAPTLVVLSFVCCWAVVPRISISTATYLACWVALGGLRPILHRDMQEA